MGKNTISVKIYNEDYLLQTGAAKEDVLEVAELVDAKMQELAKTKRSQNRSELAIWAALDLTGELIELRKSYAALLAAARER